MTQRRSRTLLTVASSAHRTSAPRETGSADLRRSLVSELSSIEALTVICRLSSIVGPTSDVDYHLIFTLDDKAVGPMRDQLPDQLRGVDVLPESLKGVGRTEVPIDGEGEGRPLDEHGQRAVADRLGSPMNDTGNRSDAE